MPQADIPFSHTSPAQQRGFRLLELPPELLEILEDKKGNAQQAPLQLKSSPQSSTATTSSSPSSEFVNLCTPTQTYFLRQVHSSNSIFIIYPSESSSTSAQANTDESANQKTEEAVGVTAFGQCKSTLEVQPPRDKDTQLRKAFRRAVRVYSEDDAEVDVDGGAEMMDVDNGHGTSSESAALARFRVFVDIPFSHAECVQSWIMHCAFVHRSSDGHGEGARCYRPTAELKLSVWSKILDASVSEGMDLEKQFLVRDLWTAALGEDAERPMFPMSLFEAVIRRVRDADGKSDADSIDSGIRWANLDLAKLVTWVGEVYLEATAPDPALGISRSEFLGKWQDLVPEKCRGDVSLDKIKDLYRSVDASSICFKQSG